MERIKKKVSLRTALLLFFGLYLLAASLAGALLIGSVNILWLCLVWCVFPSGMVGVFPEGDHDSSLALFIGYGVYALFLVLLLQFRRRPAFYVVTAFYVALLLLNGVGCAVEESRKAYREQHWEEFK